MAAIVSPAVLISVFGSGGLATTAPGQAEGQTFDAAGNAYVTDLDDKS